MPVIGNHDTQNVDDYDGLLSTIDGLWHASTRDTTGNYFVDYENARIIVVNGYAYDGNELGVNSGCINDAGRAWVDSTIRSAENADHVFVAIHEPAFPRGRHVGDSFDQCPELRNAFWNMLVAHGAKVKAVLVGHTHVYYRMRVLDPAGADANDPSAYPDEDGGVYQVDCGACGNGSRNTVVNIEIDGPDVHFKVVDAPNGADGEFSLKDEWSILGSTDVRSGHSPETNGRFHPAARSSSAEGAIRYWLGRDSHVSVAAYTVTGQRCRILYEGEQRRGEHRVRWDLRQESDGLAAAGAYVVVAHMAGERICLGQWLCVE